MKWVEASITTTNGTELVEAVLLGGGITEWQVIDREEMRSFLADNPHQWDYIDERLFEDFPENVTIRFYVSDDESGRLVIETIKAGLSDAKNSTPGISADSLALCLKHVDGEDWLDNWKEFFKPIEIGRNIVIKPAWEQYARAGKIVVNIDPDRAFGTGQHETTRLCIEALERCVSVGDIMLDLGCGSGILSVVGLLIGAEKCISVDINQNASDVTRQNAVLNGIDVEKLCVLTGDIINCQYLQKQIKGYRYDCVVANIVADVIISLTALTDVMGCIKPGGFFIVSGIIKERRDEVLSALTDAGFTTDEVAEAGQWVCITSTSGFEHIKDRSKPEVLIRVPEISS